MSSEQPKYWHAKTTPTCEVAVHIAGDHPTVVNFLRQYVFSFPRCVTVERQTFVYEGGVEEGVVVTVRRYPRFDHDQTDIQLWHYAEAMGHWLADRLGQWSFMIVSRDQTKWLSRKTNEKAPGATGG